MLASMGPTVRGERSYVGPSFTDAKVYDAMRVGVVTCRPTTALVDVARMMVGYDMHSVVVSDVEADSHSLGIVSSLDLAGAAGELHPHGRRGGEHGPDHDRLRRAAQAGGGVDGRARCDSSDRRGAGHRAPGWRDLDPRDRRRPCLRKSLSVASPEGQSSIGERAASSRKPLLGAAVRLRARADRPLCGSPPPGHRIAVPLQA
jgi:CBS domain